MINISNDQISVTANSIGGELLSIHDIKTGTEYLWQGDSTFWGRRALNIFPFVGRLFQKMYTLNGVCYSINIHGFLPNAEMELVFRDTDSCCFCLRENEETLAMFPYAFEFFIKYKLIKRTLYIEFQVHNCSVETMYCAMGGHPGFNLPLEQGLTFEDYNISFPTPCEPNLVEFTPTVLCTGVRTPYLLEDGYRLPLRHSLFKQDAVVFADMPRSVTISSPKGTRKITVDFPQMPYIGFWHKPNSEAPFVCIEPWSSLPGREGVVEETKDMQDLTAITAGEYYSNQWSISIY
ncbi:MAG: aldose 1-epimerase family protein [Mobilitalea sp.]